VYKETHDANIAEAVAGHRKTTITMNRYAMRGVILPSEASRRWMKPTFCDTVCDMHF